MLNFAPHKAPVHMSETIVCGMGNVMRWESNSMKIIEFRVFDPHCQWHWGQIGLGALLRFLLYYTNLIQQPEVSTALMAKYISIFHIHLSAIPGAGA
jgi:hypothetical protein